MAKADISPKYPRPSLLNSVNGILGMWMERSIDSIQGCMPAIFLGYQEDSRESGMAWVQPLVMRKKSNGETEERGKILLPIHHLQHGTFMIDAPLIEGDTGWIIAGDRDNTNVLAANGAIQGPDSGIGKHEPDGKPIGNQGPQPPGMMDSHKYLYGFFLPDKWGGIPLPPKFRDSLVIGQVNPNATSHGRFVLDPDGTIHVLSTRWVEPKTQLTRGGAVFVDLSWKAKLPKDLKESWKLGELKVIGVEEVLGNLGISEWTDPDGNKFGGNLLVHNKATIGGGLEVKGGAKVENGLAVDGQTDINGNVHIHDNTSRSVDIEPGVLVNGNAKFVLKTILTGKDENRSHDGKVYLAREQAYVLADPGIPMEPVEIAGEGGGGGGGDFVIEPFYVRRREEGSGQYVCYLPSNSLWYNGKEVSIHAGDPVEGNWYLIDGAEAGETVYCYIYNDGSDGYFARMFTSSSEAEPGVVAYFEVATITGVGAGLWEGVHQVAAGEMLLTEPLNPVPFDLLYLRDDGNTPKGIVRVLNPTFYWDGSQHAAVGPQAGQPIEFQQNALQNKTLYLNMYREKEGDGKLSEWKFEVDVQDNAAKGQDGNGGYSYELYKFDGDGKVEIDYRHSFLELNGKVETDDISVKWHQHIPGQQIGDELSIKGWHTQKDINGNGNLPAGDPNEEEQDNNPGGGDGTLSIEAMIVEGRGEGYSGYQVLAREKPGGHLVYIPIGIGGGGSGDDSSEEPGGSSEESSEEPCECRPYAYQLRVLNGKIQVYLPQGSLYVNGTEKGVTVAL